MANEVPSDESVPTLIQVSDDQSKCSLCGTTISVVRDNDRFRRRTRAEQDGEHARLFAEHVKYHHAKASD